MFRSHLHVIFSCVFPYNFSLPHHAGKFHLSFQQMKLHVQKSENRAPQNYQSKFREVTCFEEKNLSHTRASKFQPLA